MSESGPHSCMRCCRGTWNDDDICDDCRREAMTHDSDCATNNAPATDDCSAKLAECEETARYLASWDHCWPGNISLEVAVDKAAEAIPALIAMVRECHANINLKADFIDATINDCAALEARATVAEADAAAARKRVRELEADYAKLHAAFRANALRWNPGTSHAEIDAEVNRALGRQE